jgi:cytidylate kinase
MTACPLGQGAIVGIIGCAGSGKSSVTRRLSENDFVRTFISPSEYKIQCLKYIILKLPVLLLLCLPRVRRHYLKTIIRGEAALAATQREKKRLLISNKTLVLDQGPIFKLAYLYQKGAPNKIVERWLKTLQKKGIPDI